MGNLAVGSPGGHRRPRRVKSKLQHASIRASAGTGKTYQLAHRYIALLLLQAMGGGKSAPEKIVAATFTRKGAGEFTGRILHRLAAAAGDARDLKQLQADLTRLVKGDGHQPGLAPGVELDMSAAALQSALEVMMDQFDRLVLGTIDGFMARSVQTLAFELGLSGFTILEEGALERQRQELLGEVFCAVPAGELESFYQTLKRATLKSSSSLRQELDTFVKAYHPLLHTLPAAEAWGGPAFWGGTVPTAPNPSWKQEAAALAEQVADHDFGHASISKSLISSLTWLAARNPGSAGSPAAWLKEDGKLAELWHEWPAGEWTFEYQRKLRTVPASILNALRPILADWIAAECAALSQKTAAIHEIVSSFEQHYNQRARRQGCLAFSDLPLLLADSQGEALQMLAFRWYQQFDHWLLDEFQDTSRAQWGVLRPWLDEAIQDDSGTKSVFVVGDPKQSIYGWRGGEPRLFGELIRSYPGAFTEQVMAESWRSRPAVLELVNRICDPQNNPALCGPELFSAAALQRWHYDTHCSAPKRQSKPGYAAVLLTAKPAPAEKEDSATDPENEDEESDPLAAQAQVIKSILETVRPLEQGLTCAILVRKNSSAQSVADWLRNHGFPQVMVEGVATLAEQSPVVAALADAVRWLAAPAHSLAAGLVSLTPLWEVLERPLKKLETGAIPSGTVWRHWQERIAEVGAPQITDEWCTALSATQPEPYVQYCLRHVSQLARQAGAALTLPDWRAALERLEVRETAAVGALHVMTLHKAKGLGFDVVFLPDLDSGSGGAGDILMRRDAQGCATGCLAYPSKWMQTWTPALGACAAAQKADQDLEALCVLYVALTRAKEATFVILNQERPRRTSRARDWILSAVAQPDLSSDGPPPTSPWGIGALHWEHGSRNFYADLEKNRAPAPASRPTPPLPAPVPRRKRRQPADAGHPKASRPGLPKQNSGGLEFGAAVHKVFEQIEWWTPGQRLEGDREAVALVRKCLALPEIRALFTCNAPGDEALRELPVEFLEANSWWSGIVDRLVLRRDASGSLRQALLMDYKTDRVETADTLRDRYSEQLAVYRRAVATALGLPATEVRVFLLSTHLEALLPLESV